VLGISKTAPVRLRLGATPIVQNSQVGTHTIINRNEGFLC
jgi:hypothetical protein